MLSLHYCSGSLYNADNIDFVFKSIRHCTVAHMCCVWFCTNSQSPHQCYLCTNSLLICSAVWGNRDASCQWQSDRQLYVLVSNYCATSQLVSDIDNNIIFDVRVFASHKLEVVMETLEHQLTEKCLNFKDNSKG